MTTVDHSDPTTDQPSPALDRRYLLRGGAVLAVAAGATAVGATMAPTTAKAADGQFMVVGAPNACESTTAITLGAGIGGLPAALTLTNVNGPSLRLAPVGDEWVGDLRVGDIVTTDRGPLIGVNHGGGVATTSLVTALDLDGLPFLIPVSPFRLVDTRRAAGRAAIVASSPLAFDSSHRLKAGAWMDIGVVPEESLQVDAAFVNLKAVSPAKSGTLSVYRPADDRPLSTTVNFPASETTACAAFVGCSVVQEWMSVRIYASATTHVVMELTGASIRLSTGPNEVSVASSGGSPYETGAARLKKALAQPR